MTQQQSKLDEKTMNALISVQQGMLNLSKKFRKFREDEARRQRESDEAFNSIQNKLKQIMDELSKTGNLIQSGRNALSARNQEKCPTPEDNS